MRVKNLSRKIGMRTSVTTRRTDREGQRSIVGIQRLRKEVDAPTRHAATLLATRADDEERIRGFHSAALAVLSRETDAHRRCRSQKLYKWRESARLTETALVEVHTAVVCLQFCTPKTYAAGRETVRALAGLQPAAILRTKNRPGSPKSCLEDIRFSSSCHNH